MGLTKQTTISDEEGHDARVYHDLLDLREGRTLHIQYGESPQIPSGEYQIIEVKDVLSIKESTGLDTLERMVKIKLVG